MRTLLILAALLFGAAPNAHAALRILGEIGAPAIGFPEGWVYWNVQEPAIGQAGHVAFTGAGDTSVFSTANNTDAVWTGLPGAISLMIQENDLIVGLPGNVLFSSPSGSPVVTHSGHVGFAANLKGAVTFNQNDGAILAHVDGVTKLVLREGVQAPGFDPGQIVEAGFPDFSFSDAGMVLWSEVANQDAVWFWDFQTTERILAAGDAAGPDLPGCTLNTIFPVAINHNGDIVFRATLSGTGCPSNAIFELVEGVPQTIVVDDEPVPGMTDVIFPNPGAAGRWRLNDAGEVIFQSFLRTTGVNPSADSWWVARADGEFELVALQDESLQGSPNELLRSNMASVAHSVTNARTAMRAWSTTTFSILVGEPRDALPYGAVSEAGANQLEVVAQEGASPPGFPITWFYDDNSLQAPLVGGEGFVVWSGVAADALDPVASRTNGIWMDTLEEAPTLVAAENIELEIDGAPSMFTRIYPLFASSSQSGLPTQISEDGWLVFEAERSPGQYAIVLAPEPGSGSAGVAIAVLAALAGRRRRGARGERWTGGARERRPARR